MASLDSLDALLEEELKDIYDAEKQLTKALPKMAKKAGTPELKQAFEDHLSQTQQQIERIERVFEQLELPVRGKKCEGMKHLIAEGEEMIAEAEDDATRDAVMIAGAQKIEHYEIASYGTLRTWAGLLGRDDVASLLEETLEEEKETDQRLTMIAEQLVNQAAADEGEGDEESEPRARSSRASSGAAARAVSSARARQQAADRKASSARRAKSRRR